MSSYRFLHRIALGATLLAGALLTGQGDAAEPQFRKQVLSEVFFGEGAGAGDFDQDGAHDIVSGPYVYWGPDYKEKSELYPPKPYSVNGYSDNFFAFPYDVDGDAKQDVVFVGFPGQAAWWMKNPGGAASRQGKWDRFEVLSVVDNESPIWGDLTGDGKPELVCAHQGQYGYASVPTDPTKPWPFQPISPVKGYQRFTHGLGIGDVNDDGRMDLLEKEGWWEQPATASSEPWKHHAFAFSGPGGAQMYAIDLDGDGKNEVITSLAAHGFGLAYYRKTDATGDKFERIDIMTEKVETSPTGISISQLHAIDIADVNRDGVPDIITGKRWWAHNGNDAGENAPAILVWFETVRTPSGLRFIPHEVDRNSGIGTQVTALDINKDQRIDFIVGNKRGTFVFTQLQDGEAPPVAATSLPAATESLPIEDKLGGFRPAIDGRPLNFDFETGTLEDWQADGGALLGQPIAGDAVAARRPDMKSQHQGAYWVGTYEIIGDKPTGELVSRSFKLTHPIASFLIAGGRLPETSIELVESETKSVIARVSGSETEAMKRAVLELKEHVGKTVFIRLRDGLEGGWGHTNFDDFRLHATMPEIPAHLKISQLDRISNDRLSPTEAAAAMTVPEGFEVQLFAGEPDVTQPIAMTIDDRGRLWVAEAFEYPQRAKGDKGRDRIVIFEDVDGDGKFDHRTLFYEGLNLVSGLEVGFGGVWVGAAPYLMFIPDANHDDKPDSEPQILLDGWAYQDTHETLNAFIWGPDGWLYGCHGVFTHSRVGKPGTPDEQRQPINAGVWRYHPLAHKFEVFAHGTSNPWGVDFNDQGQAVITACVIPHLYHMIQNGRYERQAGGHFNPHTYDDIKTIALHRHWVGDTPHSGNNRSDSAGGGHAHAGAMIYLGGSWPEEYRNQIFMNNIHGARINQDKLAPRGSGLVGDRAPDFLLANDRSSQILYLRYGPDGQVYMIDWYDIQQCHLNDASKHDRSNGRIFRVALKGTPTIKVDLSRATNEELVAYQLHENDWFVRQSRRILQERCAAGQLNDEVYNALENIAFTGATPEKRLRGAWALHTCIGLNPGTVSRLMKDSDPYVRAWAIQLEAEDGRVDDGIMSQWQTMADSDPSPVVRLYLTSAAIRLGPSAAAKLLPSLVQHAEDNQDHNLPLMYWYATETLIPGHLNEALQIARLSEINTVREFVIRRIAAEKSEEMLNAIVAWLSTVEPADRIAALDSLQRGLEGIRQLPTPQGWKELRAKLAAEPDSELQTRLMSLAVTFQDGEALTQLRQLAVDAKGQVAQRLNALATLRRVRDPELRDIVHVLLQDPTMRSEALRAAASVADEGTIAWVRSNYAELQPEQRRDAIYALASRASSAKGLLDAIADKAIPSADLSADMVRQITSLGDAELSKRLEAVWGNVRAMPADRTRQMERMKALITASDLTKPDPSKGRVIYAKTCQQCHKIFDAGGAVGPELTGSNRRDIDYLLSNVVDPSAVMAKDYQPYQILTNDGQVIVGLLRSQDERSVKLQTASEEVLVYKDEIDTMKQSNKSMMPENLLDNLTTEQIRDLVAYLQSDKQVDAPAGADLTVPVTSK